MTKQKILVPIDFSGCSIKALEVAINLAKGIDATITIMNACQKPAAYTDASVTAYSRDLMREAEVNAKDAFKSVEASLGALRDVEHQFQVKHAFPKDAIISHAQAGNTDLIVMGTTGASGLKGILYGSNTHSVIKNVQCPVLAVPEASSVTSFENIVMAGDYQETPGKDTFDMLSKIAKASGSEIHVLHVSEEPVIQSGETDEAQKLDRYFKNIKHSFHFKLDQHVDDGINDYIDEHNIDLLVIVPKKHKLLERIFKASVTKKMAYHSKIPLLVLHEN
ncbi:hypothetical protein BFP97_05535 [Roseivirga sp. 4D4]|uniref:universal stress protein n=1 Tax=Roseivirga sp. 4D4 TaxID=1889784 RepID=UPI000852CDCC|nr:universal stress protein [Roseivirga sp. 4D4]OEK01005.1 hypothetical protein BFP97_05535 [Roseivirga sp. 4D4]